MKFRQKHGRAKDKPISPEQLSAWQARRESLCRMLEREPDGEWAWLWGVRIKVLDYLLDQHGKPQQGESPVAGAAPATREVNSPADTSTPAPAESTSPYDRGVDHAAVFRDDGLFDRNEKFSRLASLHQSNEARRSREKPIPPTPPPISVLQQVLFPTLFGEDPAEKMRRGIRRTTYPESQAKPFTDEELQALAEALQEIDERGYKALRRVIAFDLDLLELTDELLDEQTIRAILDEHGITPDDFD